ncbi:MAG TPA: class I SAM-dependent methyltransferase [Chloroflexi bacterium]|nr:class I SAM-dependent methyltransferase [Chloroflexota bacterium]
MVLRLLPEGRGVDRGEMIALIRAGVPEPGGTWADLGAGTGNFTWALRALLGPRGTIYAIDRDAKAIRRQRELFAQAEPGAAILPVQADFTCPLDLPPLDGVLMANALHFVRDQAAALTQVARYLRPGGRFLLVEYDVHRAGPWVPFPLPFERFQLLAPLVGLSAPALVGTRRSPSSGITMYASVAVRPTHTTDGPARP